MERLFQRLIIPHLQRSDEWNKRRRGLGAYWEPLNPFVEFSTEFANAGPDGFENKISVRKRADCDKNIGKLVFAVEVFGTDNRLQSQRYPQPPTTVENLERSSQATQYLGSLPKQGFMSANGGLYTKVSGVKVETQSMIVDDRPVDCSAFEAKSSHLTHTTDLNSSPFELWGRSWNIDLYVSAEYYLMLKMKRAASSFPIKFFQKILTSPSVLQLLLWTSLILGYFEVSEDGEVHRKVR